MIAPKVRTPKVRTFGASIADTVPWADVEGALIREALSSGHYLVADVGLPKPYYEIVMIGIAGKPKDRTMNLQDIRYILKNDLKDMMESRRTGLTETFNVHRHNINPDINVCIAPRSENKRELQDPPMEKTREIGFEYFVSGYESFEAKAEIGTHEEANGNNMATQTLDKTFFLSHGKKDQNTSNVSVSSLYLSEMDNSIISGSQHDALEELDRVLEEEVAKSETSDNQAEITNLHLREILVNAEPNDIAESSSTKTVTEAVHNTDNESSPSEAEGSAEFEPTRSEVTERLIVVSTLQHHISSCVLNNKISKTLVNQAETSLSNTEKKLQSSLGNKERHESFTTTNWSFRMPPKEGNRDEVDTVRNIFKSKSYSEGSKGFSPAVGPPGRYIPPESHLHGASSTVAKDTRKVQSDYVMSSGKGSTRQGKLSWTVYKVAEEEKLGDQADINEQVLYADM
ncbi:inactive serine/threonine-protein kinase TEX14 [Ambystoma mexicanum]|uniref:inactive serine/threonine-protein kinase TEX14 n=1 Tax=Ambystoma mexicanum TaxID=8296 RepID=UPI0037E839FE